MSIPLAVFVCYIIGKVLVYITIILLPILLLIMCNKYIFTHIKNSKIENYINNLTKKESLNQLNTEEKYKLAKLIYTYYTNKKSVKQILKDDLLYMGLGYSIGSMGLDRVIRIGVGYTLINKYIKPKVKRLLNEESNDRS